MDRTLQNEESAFKFWARIVALVVLALIALGLVLGSWFTVEEYQRGIVTTWGKVTRIEPPGLGFKIPFVQSVDKWRVDVQSVQPQHPANTYTEDNQEIDILWTAFYTIPPDKIAFVYANAQDYVNRLFNITNDRIKNEMGKVKLEHFALHRGLVREEILKTLKHDAEVLGLNVTDFQFTDVQYTKAFRVAVEQASVQKAQVETREWERQQAEKQALTAKAKAEGEANAAREAAKGKADAIRSVAEAEAQSIRVKGQATAEAMKAQADALSRNPVLVEMKKAEQWNGALPVQMLSGVTPFMTFNAPEGK